MINPKDCTIIIPHLGGTKESEYALDECLKSLRETCDIKIVVAVNGQQCIVDHDVNGIQVLAITEQGQCKAVNAAVATTNTPWIFVTNDDMIYAPGWWDKLLEFDPTFKCLSPRLVEPRKGAPTFIEYFCGGAGGDFDKQKFLDFVKNYKELDSYDSRGFNLPFLITREVWDTIGGYDINFDPWSSNSDSDLEYKIKLAGIQPRQNDNCLVYHFSQTSGTFEPRNDEYRFKNYAYFKEKWGFDRTDNGIWEATFEIPTKEEGRIFSPSWEGKYNGGMS